MQAHTEAKTRKLGIGSYLYKGKPSGNIHKLILIAGLIVVLRNSKYPLQTILSWVLYRETESIQYLVNIISINSTNPLIGTLSPEEIQGMIHYEDGRCALMSLVLEGFQICEAKGYFRRKNETSYFFTYIGFLMAIKVYGENYSYNRGPLIDSDI